MKLLFLGDIVGRTGRDAVLAALPGLRRRLAPDIIVANGENAAHGFGITAKIADQLLDAGIDCITTGNHVWDQREIISYIERQPRLLRPANLTEGTPGNGSAMVNLPDGRQVLVVSLMGRLFMPSCDDPFATIDRVLAGVELPRTADAVLVDFHSETTSEKMAMGHHLDGRASLVVGTHTHIPTADAQILPGGTGYLTDAGMCGDYDSVIGMGKAVSVERFIRQMPGERMEPAAVPATVCGIMLETDAGTGLARHVAPLRLGGRLAPTEPEAIGG